MRDLAGFRLAVRECRRSVARTQQQLARSIGLHPDVLSHKLHGSDHAVLTAKDVTVIVTTLAQWSALRTRAEAEHLLALMDVPPRAITAQAWAAPPLAYLVGEESPDSAEHPPARGSTRPHTPQPLGWHAPAAPPAPLTPLIGRLTEQQAIRQALSTSRLVTLTGAGGTGKTRLALHLGGEYADRHPGGVAFADLASVPEPGLLAIAVARSVGLRPSSADTAEDDLVGALLDRPMLFVLDNLEHLLDATALLTRLLAAAPQTRILATSRMPLRLYGETVLRVPPLRLGGADGPADSEAVQLFMQRARAAGADVAAEGEDLTAVVEICAALDGLPLAIELAAARARLYSPHDLLALLGDRLSILTGGPRNLPRRQQTLRATLDWSHDLLTPSERHLFACLGVFAGAFDAAMAAAVHGDSGAAGDMLPRLDVLCDQSLLEVRSGATPRFWMLATVREYALARLAQTAQYDEVHRRHLDYCLTMATMGGGAETVPEQRVNLDELETVYPNIRAAFDFASRQHADTGLHTGMRLAISLVPLWQHRLSLAEGAWQLDRLLVVDTGSETTGAATRTRALIELGVLECFRGDYARAAVLAEQGLALYRDSTDTRILVRAHRVLGEAALAIGDDDTAQQHFRRQLAEAERSGNQQERASAYNMLGQVARHQGHYADAVNLLHHSLRLFNTSRDRNRVGSVLNSLGEVARDAGDAERARRLFTVALHRHRQVGNARGMAYDLEGLAAVTANLHADAQQALRYLGAAQVLRERVGAPLPPVEQAILTSMLDPALATVSAEEREQALSEGRSRPLADTVGHALADNTPHTR